MKLPKTVSEWGVSDYVPDLFYGFYGNREFGDLEPQRFKRFFERQDRSLVTIDSVGEKQIELADDLVKIANVLVSRPSFGAKDLPVMGEIVTAIARIYGGDEFAEKWKKYTSSCEEEFVNSVDAY